MPEQLKITVLVDNAPTKWCAAELGLSYLVEYDQRVLFDTGASNLFLKNAEVLGSSLEEVDNVVLSHGHSDHGNGLKWLKNKTLICHPDAFCKRYKKTDHLYEGLNLTFAEAQKRFQLLLTKKPCALSDNMVFLGEIPRVNNFENVAETVCYKINRESALVEDDHVLDDSALAVITPRGLVIITGCSHSGICNIIEYAKKVTSVDNIHGVIGGFHLGELNNRAMQTIQYMKEQRIEHLYPSHCTPFPVLVAFHNLFKNVLVHSGDTIRF